MPHELIEAIMRHGCDRSQAEWKRALIQLIHRSGVHWRIVEERVPAPKFGAWKLHGQAGEKINVLGVEVENVKMITILGGGKTVSAPVWGCGADEVHAQTLRLTIRLRIHDYPIAKSATLI